jgi:hypothetical protein
VGYEERERGGEMEGDKMGWDGKWKARKDED